MSESGRNLRHTPDLPSVSHKCLTQTHAQTLHIPGTWMFVRIQISFTGSLERYVWRTRECLQKRFGYDALNCYHWRVTAEREVRHTATDTGFVLHLKQPAYRTPSPRDSKPLICYLVAKGIVSRTLTVLCTKYRGILIRYHKLHPWWLHKCGGSLGSKPVQPSSPLRTMTGNRVCSTMNAHRLSRSPSFWQEVQVWYQPCR